MNETEASQTEHIERYLLGDLPDEETRVLERQMLEQPGLFTRVEMMEDELVDRYVRDELSASDRKRFEQHLLPSARIGRRVTFARNLHRAAEERAAEREVDTAETGSFSPTDNLVSLPAAAHAAAEPRTTFSSRLAWAACLVALVGAGALALVDLRLQDHLQGAERAHQAASIRAAAAEHQVAALQETADTARASATERETLRRQLAASQEQVATLEQRIQETAGAASDGGGQAPQAEQAEPGASIARKLLLLTTITRGGADHPAPLELPAPGGVELQIDLDRHRPPEESLMVTIRRSGDDTDGMIIWRQTGLSPRFFGSDSMLPVDLPEQILLPGTYHVRVDQMADGTTQKVGVYDFMIRP